MKQILIITTKGCEACQIAKRNVDSALVSSSIKSEIFKKVIDREDAKNIIKINRIKDFPAVLYIDDDKVLYKAIGSYPSAIYLRWIDIYFKK